MNSWTMHTMIPDMREKEWDKKIKKLNTERRINTKQLVKKLAENYGVCYKPKKEELTLVLARGDFYHHIKEVNNNHKIYYFNISLVKEVVGSEEHDIYGYLIEFLAYGFFQESIRKAIINSNHNNQLFVADKFKTMNQDLKTINQYYKIFHNEP